MIDETSVAAVLAYARSSGCVEYDQIGFRIRSVLGNRRMSTAGEQTMLGTLTDASDQKKLQGTAKARRRRSLRNELEHLSFGLKLPANAEADFFWSRRECCLVWQHDGRRVERHFSVTEVPDKWPVREVEQDSDRLLTLARTTGFHADDIWWVPFLNLVGEGRFVRMQEWSKQILNGLDPSSFHIFVSHRWRESNQPDPDGVQAALLAWQVVGYLVEAIRVGAARGRHAPRQVCAVSGVNVGIYGSDLAESILVNLLRCLPADVFATLNVEAEQFTDGEDDYGVSLARNDIGLKALRSRLTRTPQIEQVLGQIRIWYDYACMPQNPRTSEEQSRFERILKKFWMIQVVGRTAILLDTVEDYFGRAWCTFESVLGHQHLRGSVDVMCEVGRSSTDFTSESGSFMTILKDRPHLIWRGILDTEVFGIQSRDDCMSRLGLKTTHPQDRQHVYELLCGLGPPVSIHTDGFDVVTGVFPLPLRDGKVVFSESKLQRVGTRRFPIVSTVDVSESTNLVLIGSSGLPAFKSFSDGGSLNVPSGHVAIFGCCEAEAILYARWVQEHRQTLGKVLGISVASMSWVADDVAPVGHFSVEDLMIRPIHSNVWVVLGSSSNLEGGTLLRFLTKSLRDAEIEYVELAIDRPKENLRRYYHSSSASSDSVGDLRRLDPDDRVLTTHLGGLFLDEFMRRLGVK